MSESKSLPDTRPATLDDGARVPIFALILAGVGISILAAGATTATTLLSMVLMSAAFALYPALSPAAIGLLLPFYLLAKNLGPLAFSMPELALFCALAGAGLNWIARQGRRRSLDLGAISTPLDRPIALFLAAALLSLLASEVLRVSLRDLRTLVVEPVAAYYLATTLLRKREQFLLLMAGLLLGGTVAAGQGIYQYLFTDQVITAEGSRRILGPYMSPNHLGLYLGRLLPIAVAATLSVPRLRPASAAVAVILGGAILLTFSLGAWLASFLAVLAVAFLWNVRGALALTAASAGAAVLAIPILQLERITSHFSLSSGTSFFRVQLWQSSLEMIRDHPILGVGMDNFLYNYRSDYLQPGAAAEPNLSHPHNLILNFWLQMGILGVISILWLVVSLARIWVGLWRTLSGPLERAVLAGLAGAAVDMLAHGAVDNSYFLVDLAFQFWLASAALVVMTRLPEMK